MTNQASQYPGHLLELPSLHFSVGGVSMQEASPIASSSQFYNLLSRSVEETVLLSAGRLRVVSPMSPYKSVTWPVDRWLTHKDWLHYGNFFSRRGRVIACRGSSIHSWQIDWGKILHGSITTKGKRKSWRQWHSLVIGSKYAIKETTIMGWPVLLVGEAHRWKNPTDNWLSTRMVKKVPKEDSQVLVCCPRLHYQSGMSFHRIWDHRTRLRIQRRSVLDIGLLPSVPKAKIL